MLDHVAIEHVYDIQHGVDEGSPSPTPLRTPSTLMAMRNDRSSLGIGDESSGVLAQGAEQLGGTSATLVRHEGFDSDIVGSSLSCRSSQFARVVGRPSLVASISRWQVI